MRRVTLGFAFTGVMLALTAPGNLATAQSLSARGTTGSAEMTRIDNSMRTFTTQVTNVNQVLQQVVSETAPLGTLLGSSCANGTFATGVDEKGGVVCSAPPLPPVCVGDNKALQWNGNSWSCAISSVAGVGSTGESGVAGAAGAAGAAGLNATGSFGFGTPSSHSVDTVYRAATDGFLTVTFYSWNDSIWMLPIVYSDANPNPTTVVGRMHVTGLSWQDGSTITIPIKAGNYWRVALKGQTNGSPVSHSVIWTPLGGDGGEIARH